MAKIQTRLARQALPDRIAYRIVRDLVTVICRVWCRMTIEGRHNVPKSGVFILAPTHRSILDTPITASLRRKRLRFMAADKWWKNEAFGKLITALGGFPVSRGTADREALKRSILLIDDGEPLVLFPEGERKSGPEVQPLFDGATYIAMKAGVPIIPVAIGGSERAMPKGAKFVYPRRLHVVVGEPMSVPDAENSKLQRVAAQQLTVELRDELQRLFDRANAVASGRARRRPAGH